MSVCEGSPPPFHLHVLCVRSPFCPLAPNLSFPRPLQYSCQAPSHYHDGGLWKWSGWLAKEEGSSYSCQAKITLISLIQLIVHEDVRGRVAYRPNEEDCSGAFPILSLVYLQRSRGFSIAGAREPFHVFGWYATPIWKGCLPASYLLIINCCKL